MSGEFQPQLDECFMAMDEPIAKLSGKVRGAMSPCATLSRLRGAMRCELLGVEVRERVVEFAVRLLRCQSSKLGSWDGDARLGMPGSARADAESSCLNAVLSLASISSGNLRMHLSGEPPLNRYILIVYARRAA